ncbi:MAG: aminotransferase class IV [Bacteroidota bacterium]
MPRYCFFNNRILPADKATIHINDLGLLRSYAVFDFLRTYNGKPFRIHEHMKRFSNSAGELRLTLRYSESEIIKIIEKLLKKSKLKEAAIRLVLTGGYSPDSISVTEPNFLVIIEELPYYPPEIYQKGVKLITSEYQRDVPLAKTTHYLNAIRLKPEKEKHNAYDILYYYKDEVLETTRNNLFIFKGNTLVTPCKNILLGITRGLVLELAKDHFIIEVRRVPFSELKQADEAFVTGTTMQIIPVVQIDDHKINDGKIGKNTIKMMKLFDDYTKDY